MMTRLGVLDDAVSGKLISSQEVEKVDDNDEDNDSRIWRDEINVSNQVQPPSSSINVAVHVIYVRETIAEVTNHNKPQQHRKQTIDPISEDGLLLFFCLPPIVISLSFLIEDITATLALPVSSRFSVPLTEQVTLSTPDSLFCFG